MKRMVDNKKLREIEASGGTQWYKHEINLNNGTVLTLITLRQDALKDGGWPNSNYLAFLVFAAGPSRPDVTTSFPNLRKNASTSIQIKYINNSNQVSTYELSERDIDTEVVTAL